MFQSLVDENAPPPNIEGQNKADIPVESTNSSQIGLPKRYLTFECKSAYNIFFGNSTTLTPETKRGSCTAFSFGSFED